MTSSPSTEIEVTPAPEGPGSPILRCSGIGKRFGETWAVSPLDLRIDRGRVHALVGENGAGKSTLLGMICGRLSPTVGRVEIEGHQLKAGRPRQAQRLGVSAVYQEMTLVPTLTALQNVFLGHESTRFGIVRSSGMYQRFAELCDVFGISIDADALVSGLPIAQQQMLEILRAIESDAKVLVLDEPTAALAETERARLHDAIRTLRSRGTTIVLVSHHLDEVMALSDDITVLRNGRLIRSAPRSTWTRAGLIASMIGRDLSTARLNERSPVAAERLRVENVWAQTGRDGIDLSVRAGEIVGLWGLVGSGRSSFLRSLIGYDDHAAGRMIVDGEEVGWNRSVREAARRGIVLVPEDRRRALFMSMDAAANVCIGAERRRSPLIRRSREREETAGTAGYFGFDLARIGHPVGLLSGGNQQKVLLAKWAHRAPAVMLIDEPTRGIDIGAKAEVLASLDTLAREGTAVVMTSSDLEEVLAVADRLIVFSRGRAVTEIHPDDPRFNVADIVRLGFEHQEAHP